MTVNLFILNVIEVCRVLCREPIRLYIPFIHYILYIPLYIALYIVYRVNILHVA